MDIHLYSDQPTTCPKCGSRTEILFEFLNEQNTQLHLCRVINCQHKFYIEEDID